MPSETPEGGPEVAVTPVEGTLSAVWADATRGWSVQNSPTTSPFERVPSDSQV
jgi:hypothetical protein